ncbi:hypothetical protein FLAV_01765 [Flavobacteriales bacterium]|nr:hypothetical protein [Flavobacteriales bacterium]MCL4816945.1 DUF2520 domain-containing protein [Flavobacteriales bacterium]WKZ76005.1 MAG: DUF2520 domain-containing protein [Vicingaceae bacterium]GIK70446.1 MAG: hypothetical protein BroJett020_17410 [Bacteroidota bacterium]CAG0980931.1 hypothetical protein FLAV_01765 [Flavobacteriales bacterium]
MQEIKTISFIGSGNVATALAIHLFKKKYTITQIYSKNLHNAKVLAKKVKAKATNLIEGMADADLCIVALKDDVIETVSKKINNKNIPIVHTSGTVSTEVFHKNNFKTFGCFYPLQTFSKKSKLSVSNFPILLEANDTKFYTKLEKMASAVSTNRLRANSQQRLNIHLAAVFACNFTNYLYSISENILQQSHFKINLLYPLIKQTAENTKKEKVFTLQTGPAIRKDYSTIKKHLELLEKNKKAKKIYRLLTQAIQEKATE